MLKYIFLTGLIVIAISTAVSAQEGVTYIEGQITVLHFDPAPGSGGEYQVVTSIYDDNGQRTELDLPAGMTVQNQERVRVHGAFMPAPQSGTPVFSVNSIEKLASSLESPTINPRSTGTFQYLTILCRFSDSTGPPPHPPSYFDDLMGNAYPGVQHYWDQVSLGQVNVVSINIGQWITMSKPMSTYSINAYNRNMNLNTQKDIHNQMAQDCIDAADPSFDFSLYEGFNMIFDRPYVDFALGGGTQLTIEGIDTIINITWNPPFSYNNVGIIAHEVGHTFGFLHSGGNPATRQYPYDSHWDVMSSGGQNYKVVDPTYGLVAPNTIAYHMYQGGWIGGRVSTVSVGEAQTLTLERMNQPVSPINLLMAKIPIFGSTTDFYTVEARFENSGYDAAIPGTGVIIHRVDTGRREPAQVVDPDGNIDVNDAGAIWLPGETFTDTEYGITVQVNTQGASSFEVCIVNIGNVCAPPSIIANDNYYLTAAATALNVNAADGVLNNDTGDNLTAILETNVSNGHLTLNPDGSFIYTPNTGFQGGDTFTYSVYNGDQKSNITTVSIFVGITPEPAPQLLALTGSLVSSPTEPVFTWYHTTQAGQTTVPGTYYRLVVVKDQTVIYDDWFEASSICSGLGCALPYPETTPGVLGKTMPTWGLVKGEHSFYVQSYIDDNSPWELSGEKKFTVDPPRPDLPRGFRVDNSVSPAQFVWTDDADALYYRLYISDGGNEPLFFDWEEKTFSLCNGLTCRFTPPTPADPGTYHFYVQPWSSGGFAPNGIQNVGWAGALVTVGPGLSTNLSSSLAGGTATLSFRTASDATSYRIWVGTVKEEGITEAHFQTYTADKLGCTTADSTCNLSLDISSFAPDTYSWYVQARGTMGDSAAGASFGWAVGDVFTVK